MDTLSEHFQRQDRRAEQLAQGVGSIAGTLEQLAKTQQAQNQHIGLIAGRVDEAAKYTAGLSSMLLEMPSSLQAQAEATRAVAKELECTRAADARLVDSLRQFSVAADSLREAGRSQTESLKCLHKTGAEESAALQRFIRQQTRRMLIATIAGGDSGTWGAGWIGRGSVDSDALMRKAGFTCRLGHVARRIGGREARPVISLHRCLSWIWRPLC